MAEAAAPGARVASETPVYSMAPEIVVTRHRDRVQAPNLAPSSAFLREHHETYATAAVTEPVGCGRA